MSIPVVLGETLVIPYPANVTLGTPPNISIKKLSDGTYVVSSAAMSAADAKGVHTYSFTVPKAEEKYQVLFEEPTMTMSGPVIVASGNVMVIVQADAGNSATVFKTDLTEAANDHFKSPSLVKFITGGLAGQVRPLAPTGAYDGTTKQLTVSSGFTGAPATGDKGVVITV